METARKVRRKWLFLKNTPSRSTKRKADQITALRLAQNSGGPGKHRGGLATEMRFGVFSQHQDYSAQPRSHAFSLLGGDAWQQERTLYSVKPRQQPRG